MDRNASRISRSAMLAILALAMTGTVITAFADDGIIVITSDVQPRHATRAPLAPDPNPNAVDANQSPIVRQATGSYELDDSDFAGISSGSGLQRQMAPEGPQHALGISTAGKAQGLPGMSAGHSRVSGSGITNQVNRSLQQGLSPLDVLTGGR